MQRHVSNRAPADTLRERVTQELRTAILHGKLPPGSRVHEDELASQLGAPAEPVRHALKLLEREGLVHLEPDRSARVAPLDRRVITDVYVLREALETSTVVLLARRPSFDPRPFRKIIKTGRAALRVRDLPALVDLDMSFHTGLYDAAGNQVIADVMRAQWGHIRRGLAMVLDQTAYRQRIWDEHDAIINAIVERKVALAGAAVGHHIRASKETLLAAFDAAALPPHPPIEKRPPRVRLH